MNKGKPEVLTMKLPAEGDDPARWVGEVCIDAGLDTEKVLYETGFCDSEREAISMARVYLRRWLRNNKAAA